MRQINVLTVVALVSVLGLAACGSRATTTSVVPTPVSVIPTATSQSTPTQTPTTIPSPSPTEMPTATPTLTPLPTPLPDPLLKGQIGFEVYNFGRGDPSDCDPNVDGFYHFDLFTIAPNGSDLRHQGKFISLGLAISWSPDGHWALLYALVGPETLTGPYGLYLVDTVRGHSVNIFTFDSTVGLDMGFYQGFYHDPVWSPRSDKAAVSIFTSASAGETGNDIYLLEVESQSLIPFITTSSHESPLSWSPDGERIAYAQWEGVEETPQDMRLMVSWADGSEPREVLCCGSFPADFHWSADSRQIVFPAFDGENLHLTRLDIEREQPFDVTQLPFSTTPLYPSPDGSRYAMVLDVEGQTDIFVVNADGSGLTNLTRHPTNDAAPIWSPDGRYIAFVSTRGGAIWLRQLYVMRADGSDVRLVSDKCVGPFSWWAVPGDGGE